jgi:hypothetical protein
MAAAKLRVIGRNKALDEGGFIVVDFVQDEAPDERGRHEEFNDHGAPPFRRAIQTPSCCL